MLLFAKQMLQVTYPHQNFILTSKRNKKGNGYHSKESDFAPSALEPDMRTKPCGMHCATLTTLTPLPTLHRSRGKSWSSGMWAGRAMNGTSDARRSSSDRFVLTL
jgi:hypothetical protein